MKQKRLLKLLFWHHGDLYFPDSYRNVEEVDTALTAFVSNRESTERWDQINDLRMRVQIHDAMKARGRWWEYVNDPVFDKHQPMVELNRQLIKAELLHPGTLEWPPVIKLCQLGDHFVVFMEGPDKSNTRFFVQRSHADRYFEHLIWGHSRKGEPGTPEYGYRAIPVAA